MSRAFTRVAGAAAPLLVDDVNTDQIAPVQKMRNLEPDYAALLFAGWRADATPEEPFVLDRPDYRDASILVVGRNFGCGSAREAAVWAMNARGISCIVARSFATLYRDNCLRNGVLPVVLAPENADSFEAAVQASAGGGTFTADLVACRLTGPDGAAWPFAMNEGERTMLLEGLDEIGLTLKHGAAIDAFEARMREEAPWRQRMQEAR